jgi:hypothetical protein
MVDEFLDIVENSCEMSCLAADQTDEIRNSRTFERCIFPSDPACIVC